MIRRFLPHVAAIAALTIAANGPALAQVSGEGAPNMAHPFGVKLDDVILKFLKENDLPGATVAVTRKGRLIWNKGYGYAHRDAGRQMEPWHRSRIGSVSKIFTALAAMKLVEEGKLNLEDRIYGTASPMWSSDLMAPPVGVAAGPTSVLQEPNAYFSAMIEGVNNLDPNFPPSASASPTLLAATLYRAAMNRTFEWASAIRVKHLLTHTSGLLRSGDSPAAAKYHGTSEAYLTYRMVHQYILTGGSGVPFEFEPGSNRQYSNHAFGVAGLIVDEKAGLGTNYREYVEQNILHPLGLTNVVPNNAATETLLDATPHDTDEVLDPSNQSRLGLPTGGWSATARDLVRVMCSIDRTHNSHRLLAPATVTTMESDLIPGQSGQPIGWDSRSGGKLSKDGRIGGGTALIHKFLPGEIAPDEINVAIAINRWAPVPYDLIMDVARAAAQAYVPDEYDLFEPESRCYEQAPTRFRVSDVTLLGFYPANTSNPLPAKIAAKCPVNIKVVGTFKHFGKGPVTYRLRFLVENKVSTTFTHVIKGDPADPLYEPEQVTHTFPIPLPPAIKPGGQGGGVPPGPGQFGVLDPPEEPPFPKPKGPALPGQVVAPSIPDTIKGTVRLEVLKPSGGVTSNPVHYHIECEPEMQILSGVVQLRDEDRRAPGCPRPAQVGASIRTNKPGALSYVLACTGEDRTWKGKTIAHETAPGTFIGVAVHPLQIAKQEEITCFLRKGEQFGFSDVIATDKQLYPCKTTSVAIPDPQPPVRPVCVGGTVASTRSIPPQYFCTCRAGRVAKQTAPNRFQCEAQLVCEGGRVANSGRPPKPSCICPAGMTAQKIGPPASSASAAQRIAALAAPKADDEDPERYRCVRVVSLPGKLDTKPGSSAVPVACSGGVVRAGKCYCAKGKNLKNGVCVASSAPSRVQ